MDQNTQSDATILWNDVLTLLQESHMNPSTLAMLESCEATDLTEDTLTIATSLGFARRKIEAETATIETCLSTAAFTPMHLVVAQSTRPSAPMTGHTTTITEKELKKLSETEPLAAPAPAPKPKRRARIVEDVPETDSKLTFDRFVSGEENMLAFEASKQVANGENKNYNPLFIYGKSGLGKTHLLRAIQNYISANDPSRLCLYRTAAQFVESYRTAMNDKSASARTALSKSYEDVDVLIIDDIQNMRTAAGSIRFFFETFNSLIANGKQIVLAADRSPSQLGMGDSKFDERETSRMDSGMTVSIQVPDYELKLNLINTFYERMKADAVTENIKGMDGTISEEMRRLMAERAGTNIRVIEGFVQSCLMLANKQERAGKTLTREDVLRVASQKWPTGQHVVTVEQIQKAIETYYDVAHADLVGSKRNKELMEPRHVAIWLTREMTDNTLADIGKKFGNRSHATVKHSIAWVDNLKRDDRLFHDRVESIRDNITDNS